jgi:spore maturation protein CgeB
MAERTRVPVAALPQATDPDRFRPGRPGPAHELLFVGNSRGVRRHVLDELLPTVHELAVYGRAWTADRLDPRYLAGDHVPNDELAGYYGSAAIVLNDHWLDMQREGFLSNRLYDAAAAGAFMISDDVEGLEEAFDGGIVGYVGADELRRLVDAFLADPAARRDCAERARAAVLSRHTFDHRARTILDAVEPLLAARASGIAGPPLEPGAARSPAGSPA